MKRINVTISGRVQMVLFRDFTKRNADKIGVVGTVKNIPDGTVHVVAEGEEEVLKKFLEKLHKGSMMSRVDDVNVSWEDATGEFQSFDIVY